MKKCQNSRKSASLSYRLQLITAGTIFPFQLSCGIHLILYLLSYNPSPRSYTSSLLSYISSLELHPIPTERLYSVHTILVKLHLSLLSYIPSLLSYNPSLLSFSPFISCPHGIILMLNSPVLLDLTRKASSTLPNSASRSWNSSSSMSRGRRATHSHSSGPWTTILLSSSTSGPWTTVLRSSSSTLLFPPLSSPTFITSSSTLSFTLLFTSCSCCCPSSA